MTSRVVLLLLVVLMLSEMMFCVRAALKGKHSLCQPISQSMASAARGSQPTPRADWSVSTAVDITTIYELFIAIRFFSYVIAAVAVS
jgi:hypothetical protein